MADDRKKAQFSPVPLRANSDARLTDRDYRILGVVAGHDRMSKVRGKGQGAWASHKTMAAEVGGQGADYARFSVSINKLVGLGYLEREPLQSDARKSTYRVVYTDEDRLQPRKQSAEGEVCSSANQRADDSLPASEDRSKIVCRGGELSSEKDSETDAQYISLSEETHSAEAGEINSPEGAHLVAREVDRLDKSLSDDANLSRLDRAITLGRKVERTGWHAWLNALDPADVRNAARIHRLIERLWDVMADKDLGDACEPALSCMKVNS